LKSLSRHILQQIVSSSSQGILLIDARDPNLPIAYANSVYEDLSDYSGAELEGQSWRSLLAGDDANPEVARVRFAIGCGEPCQATIPYQRKDGTTWFAEVAIQPLSSVGGDTRYFLCQHSAAAPPANQDSNVQVDLLQRALGQARQKIMSLSRSDPVTGLLRYEYFISLLKRDVGTARRERRSLCVAVFEIVEFDTYRRTFGANAADSCLRMIAAQITGAFRRAGDLCARCDETTFVVAVPGQRSDQIAPLASRVAEKVRNLGLHNPRGQSSRHVTVRSVLADAEGEDAAALVARVKTQLPGGDMGMQKPA
jgi:diguanylate cyclase (GGDEF)-like protein/PAS domain S-box-containing protein